MARTLIPGNLTSTEFKAEALRREDSKCFHCVHGEQAFEFYVCRAEKTWPKCIDKPNGYVIDPNKTKEFGV